jgi:glycerol-3-phosphate dehydrogenase (NAD(P)+)
VPGRDIPERLGQACEALETVPLLARAAATTGIASPVLSALARLIDGSLPLEDWVALVRARQPQVARRRGRLAHWLRRMWARSVGPR